MTIATMNDTQVKRLKLGYILIMLFFIQSMNFMSSGHGGNSRFQEHLIGLIFAIALIVGLYFILSSQDIKGYKVLLLTFSVLSIIPLIIFMFYSHEEYGWLTIRNRFIIQFLTYGNYARVLVFFALVFKGMLKDKRVLYNWIPVGLYSALILESVYTKIVHDVIFIRINSFVISIIMAIVCIQNILSLRMDDSSGVIYCSSCGHKQGILEQKGSLTFGTKVKSFYGKLQARAEKVESYYILKVWLVAAFSLLVVHRGFHLLMRLMRDYIDFDFYYLLG